MIDPTARAWAYLSRVAEPPCAQLGRAGAMCGPRGGRRPGAPRAGR